MGDSSQIWDPTQNFLHPTIAREEGSEEVHSVMDHTKTISMLTAGGEEMSEGMHSEMNCSVE